MSKIRGRQSSSKSKREMIVSSLESTGAILAAKIFLDSIKVLKQKLLALRLAEDGSALPVMDHEIGVPSLERNYNNQSLPDDVTNGFAKMNFEEEEAKTEQTGNSDACL